MVWEITIDSTKVGVLNKIVQELNGHEEALVNLPNTSANRTLVDTDKDVTIKWGATTIFFGRLKGADYQEGTLVAKVYDKVYEKMAGKDFTGEYSSTSADTILGAVCTAAGVTKGSCPSTLISVKFVKALCLDAALFVAMACNKDYWSSAGTTFNIGDRGATLGTFVPTAAPKRGVDRATKRNHVWVRGTDSTGVVIWGEAKSTGWTPETDRPRTFIERKATDATTLNNIAASKLKLLEKESSGVRVPLKISEGITIIVGDTITINQPELKLSGAYRVWKTTKTVTSVEVEIDVPEAIAEQYVLAQAGLEDLGIYPQPAISPDYNSIKNPSFEDDLDGDGIPDFWTPIQLGNPAVSKGRSSDDAKEGKYSLKIVGHDSSSYTWSGMTQDVAIEGGRTYILRVQVKALAAQPVVEIWHPILDANKNNISNVGLVERGTSPTSWTEYVAKITIAADYGGVKPAYLRVVLAYKQDSGTETTLFFDSVWVFKQITWEELFDETKVSAQFSRKYEAEKAVVVNGTISDDVSSSGGKRVCLASTTAGTYLWIIKTDNTPITGWAGDFYVIAMLMVASKASTTPTIRIGLYDQTAVTVQYIDISPSQFKNAGDWEAFALRATLRADHIFYIWVERVPNDVTDICVDWVGIVPASIPLADVEVLNQSLGIPNDDDKTLHVLDLSLGVPSDDLAEISFTKIADSGISGEVNVVAGPLFVTIQSVSVNATGYSAPMIVEAFVERQAGVSEWAHIQFLLAEVDQSNPRHYFFTLISDQIPRHRVIVAFFFKYSPATTLYIFARAQSGENCHVHGQIIVHAKAKHQHSITEQTPYRGQNDLDSVTHKHTITEPTPYRGVDKTAGYGTKKHIH